MSDFERLKDWIEESNLQLEINQVLEIVNRRDLNADSNYE